MASCCDCGVVCHSRGSNCSLGYVIMTAKRFLPYPLMEYLFSYGVNSAFLNRGCPSQ